jgi:hypothetical protein
MISKEEKVGEALVVDLGGGAGTWFRDSHVINPTTQGYTNIGQHDSRITSFLRELQSL